MQSRRNLLLLWPQEHSQSPAWGSRCGRWRRRIGFRRRGELWKRLLFLMIEEKENNGGHKLIIGWSSSFRFCFGVSCCCWWWWPQHVFAEQHTLLVFVVDVDDRRRVDDVTVATVERVNAGAKKVRSDGIIRFVSISFISMWKNEKSKRWREKHTFAQVWMKLLQVQDKDTTISGRILQKARSDSFRKCLLFVIEGFFFFSLFVSNRVIKNQRGVLWR